MQRDKTFGGFFGSAFDVMGQSFPALAIYVLVIGGLSGTGMALGLVDAQNTLGGFDIGFSIQEGQSLASVAFTLVAAIVAIVGAYFLLAKFLRDDGLMRTTDTRILPYIGMSILAGIGVIFGLLLFVIPGIILIVRWSASSGFLIGQGVGVIDSLKASWEATRGYSWPIFFAGLVLALVTGIAAGAVAGVAIFSGNLFVTSYVSAIADVASDAVFYAFAIGIYRVLNDGAEETAEVFA